MGFYKTIDDKIEKVYDLVAQRYQKATGNTNFTLMKKAGLIGTLSYSLGGLENIARGYVKEGFFYSIQGGFIFIIGYFINSRIRRDAELLENSELESMITGVKSLKAEEKKGSYRRWRIPFLILGTTGPISMMLHVLKVESEYPKILEYFGDAAIMAANFHFASAGYFATCKPRKPQKKSLWEKVKSLFTVPKLAEVTSQYQAAFLPYI